MGNAFKWLVLVGMLGCGGETSEPNRQPLTWVPEASDLVDARVGATADAAQTTVDGGIDVQTVEPSADSAPEADPVPEASTDAPPAIDAGSCVRGGPGDDADCAAQGAGLPISYVCGVGVVPTTSACDLLVTAVGVYCCAS